MISFYHYCIRVDDALDKELRAFCHHEGYSKNGLITKLLRNFLATHEPISCGDIAEAKNHGIDITLLCQNLKRSPTERLRQHDELHQFVTRLRRAAKKGRS